MEANELRTGNYVYDNLGGILKIKGISIESNLRHLKPIPLTEEWLLKLGFKYANSKEYMSFNLFRTVSLFADYSDNFSIVTLRINDTTIEFKYVHQIQNLYFDLKQEELQINN